MASITVSSNPSTTGDTLTVNFTTDATNISDILLSKDGGSTYISATSFTATKAVFNVSNWDNGTYNNCKLKCVYTESGGGTETPTTYTITNNLTDCTTSNNAKRIDANTKYSATITATTGYALSTLTVTMGGKDVTSSVVSNNVITINSVTGNVVITAKAIKETTKPDIPDTTDDTLEILPSCTYVDMAEGGSKTIYFKLSNKPTSSTTINISSSSPNLTLSSSQLTFTADNYHIAQFINVTSTSDSNETDDIYNITVSATGLTSKTITVDVIDSSNSNFEVIYDNGTLVQGASFTLNNATNNGTYISTNQNQDVSVAISNHPLSLNKNDKVHVVLGLGTDAPSSIYSLRSLVLGDGSANNISNANMINEVQINEALSNDGKVDTYWTIAADLSDITLTFTCYFARVNIYKIYIERGK